MRISVLFTYTNPAPSDHRKPKGRQPKKAKNRPPASSWLLLGPAGLLAPPGFQAKRKTSGIRVWALPLPKSIRCAAPPPQQHRPPTPLTRTPATFSSTNDAGVNISWSRWGSYWSRLGPLLVSHGGPIRPSWSRLGPYETSPPKRDHLMLRPA